MIKPAKISWQITSGIFTVLFPLLLFAGMLYHYGSFSFAQDGTGETVITAYLNQTQIIPVNNPTRLAIANPEIADISEVTKEEIVIATKAVGTTKLVVWDSLGERSYKIKVFGEDISTIKQRIDALLKDIGLPEVYTKEAADEGKVLLLGRVKTPQERERVLTAIGSLSTYVVDLIEIQEEEAAVDIDVQIVELSRDATKTLGFTMPSSVSAGEASGAYPRPLYRTMDAIVHFFEWPRSTTFTLTLSALIEEGKAKLLSQPRITCQSGKEAELTVGGEKPILTTQTVSGGGSTTSVEYKEYGIRLGIKPTVTQEDKIKLELAVDVSEVGEAVILGPENAPTALAYPLKKRVASTELFLNDGQTFAIGGLVKQKTEETVSKTAGLGDIPILGLFFRKKTTRIGGGTGELGNTELFIVLTPKIVRNEIPLETKSTGSKQAAYRGIAPAAPSDPLMSYGRFIQTRILEKINYPLLAKDAGFAGTVMLSLHLSSAGELLDVAVKNSSGYKMLDDNAVTAAKALYPYPPFPAAIKKQELWIDIPIDYRLE